MLGEGTIKRGKYNEDEDMDRDANFSCSSANSTFRTRMFPFMR